VKLTFHPPRVTVSRKKKQVIARRLHQKCRVRKTVVTTAAPVRRRRKAFVFEPAALSRMSAVFDGGLPGPPLADAHLPVLLIRIVAQLISDRANEWLQPYGLTMMKYSYLIRLYVAPEKRLRLSELARYVNSTNATAVTMINALEDDGLVRRTTDDADRRSTYVQLTARGARLIARAFPVHSANVAAALADCSKTERKQLTMLLQKVALGFESRFSESTP
jgi:DNA-binding MarR family transcriptional regulator